MSWDPGRDEAYTYVCADHKRGGEGGEVKKGGKEEGRGGEGKRMLTLTTVR